MSSDLLYMLLKIVRAYTCMELNEYLTTLSLDPAL
jgi:hypothetical protein